MPTPIISIQLTALLILFGFLYITSTITWKLYKRSKNHPFPDRHDVTVVFRECKASGCSHKNFFTRIGGAKNALIVIVTPDELWITVPWFAGWLANKCDLDQRIPLHSIIKSEQMKKKLTIHWSANTGSEHAFDLWLREPNAFLKAINAISEA